MNVRNVPISEIKIGKRRRKDMGDLNELIASVEHLGLLHPVVIGTDGSLIVGERRVRAFKKMGRETIPAYTAKSLDDVKLRLEAERDENTCRKAFAKSEAVAVARAIEAIEEPKALERMSEGGQKSKRKKGGKICPTLKRDESKRSKSVAAEAVGMSRITLDKAEQVVAAAEEDPEQFGDLVETMDATDKVEPSFQECRKRQG